MVEHNTICKKGLYALYYAFYIKISYGFAYTLGIFHLVFAYVLGKFQLVFAYALGKYRYLCL